MGKPQFNILVVDDIPGNIKVIGNSLKSKGYIVSFATSGEQGLDMARTNKTDLILLDIMMPGMDGIEVCQQLKSEERLKDIPVIFITAKTDKADIVKGFEAGGVDYVTKPFNTAELLARVQTHLELEHAKQVIHHQAEELAWSNQRLINKNKKLQNAIREIETLKGLLPVCSHCKKVRRTGNDALRQSSWITIEAYLHEHTAAEVTHSICPSCMAELYPDLVEKDES